MERPSFADASMDVVISNAVLHFARNGVHFDAMVEAMWRLLRPGGMLFARLASSIGMELRMQPVGNGRFRMPDGSERYLVDEARLMTSTALLAARFSTRSRDDRAGAALHDDVGGGQGLTTDRNRGGFIASPTVGRTWRRSDAQPRCQDLRGTRVHGTLVSGLVGG